MRHDDVFERDHVEIQWGTPERETRSCDMEAGCTCQSNGHRSGVEQLTEAHAGKRRFARAATSTAAARHGRIDRLIVRDDFDFLLMPLGRALAVDSGELEENV